MTEQSLASGEYLTSPATAPDVIPLSRDRLGLTFLVLVLGLNLALFAFLWLRYSQMPELVPMHFDAIGQPDRITPRADVFKLPVIGLIIAGTNLILGLLLRRALPLAPHLLWGGAVVVQLLLFVAAVNLVS